MKSKIYFLIPCFLYSVLTIGQVNFANRNDLLSEKDMHSAVPVAIADMNGDGLDDIVTMNGGTNLFIQYQTPDPARPFVRYELPVFIDGDAQNDICIADFNNDGANDIFAIGSYDRVKVLYSVPHTFEFDLEYVNVVPFFSQGATAGDFNGDGWVDVVALNDNGLNYSLMNDGSGNLVVQDFFNFVTVPSSDNSGNYGSVYTDFDMDGDLDFYIAKCRQGVSNSTDPRRINVLFVNDGNHTYTEDAANYGLASGRQSWTTDFGDIDNDGDLDAFMTQHDVMSELYENIGNDTFINITPSTGLAIGGVPLQGMLRDFDNDGFQDILVSGDRVDYYHNNGDKTFTRTEPFGDVVFGTFAMGDLNADGFTDVYASTVIPFNNPDFNKADFLFLGEKNDNHFLSLRVLDAGLNPSAIGSMAILYGSWGTQIREVRGGEQYGVSNGHTMIFGLGQETTYDSLIIRWPDGSREYYNGLEIDQNWTIHRGGCATTRIKLWPHLDAICGNELLELKIEGESESILWSNGSIEDSILVNETGLYYATYTNDEGCTVQTEPIEILDNPDTIKPYIFYEGSTHLCNGDIAVLSLPFGLGYEWSSGETAQSIGATLTGEYFAAVQGYCDTQYSDTISLSFLIPETPLTQQDTFLEGEIATLMATGDSIVWSSDPFGEFVIGTGPVLVLTDLTESTTVYVQNLSPIDGQDYLLGPVQHQGNKYNAAFVNGGLLFEVLEPIMLEEFTLHTDSAGTRIIEIFGPNFFYEYQVDLDSGTTIVPIQVSIPEGAYTISTNTSLNNLVFGNASPILWRSSEGVNYPYEVPGIISITNSTFGEDFYYYFYDWKVSTLDRYCGSEIIPVTAVEEFKVGSDDPVSDNELIVSPNPTEGTAWIRSKFVSPYYLQMTSPDGLILYSTSYDGISECKLDLTTFPSGIYILRLNLEGQIITKKVIKL